MDDPLTVAMIAMSVIVTISIAAVACLRGWQGWLDLKRLELSDAGVGSIVPPAGNRIELADLKERVRKLEAIAAGIDL